MIDEIKRRLERDRTLEPGDFAILFRTNEQPRVFETELRKAKLPYSLTGAQSFFDRKEVRDFLAYLRILQSPQDEVALLRILNVPPRGMGAKSIETLMQNAVSKGSNVWTSMEDPTLVGSLPSAAKNGISGLQNLIQQLQAQMADRPLVDTAQELLTRTGYMDEITRLYPEPEEQEMRRNSIEEVLNAIGAYEAENDEPSLDGFITDIALSGREFGSPKEKEAKRNAIALMTFHSAKGLEFPIVYMVGMEEGILPHRRAPWAMEQTSMRSEGFVMWGSLGLATN